jgi:murein DD-endopeptidase MepM/ murein hydrolase activator NlpD
MKTKIKYRFPIDKNKIMRVSKTDSRAHRIYKHSTDFIVPIGTPVKAAASGIVIDVKDDSNKGGSTRKYEKFENFVEIRHNDEYSYYGHLKKGGVLVKIGDRVKAGQVIGYSGDTGWMANIKEPHLHFMVGTYKYETLQIRFKPA